MKAVVIGALAATAYSADTITYPGTYKLGGLTGTNAAACCNPGDVTITQAAGGQVTVDFTFTSTAADCPVTGAVGKHITGTGTPVASGATAGDVVFTDSDATNGMGGKSFTLTAPDYATGEFQLVLDNIGDPTAIVCSATLEKAPTSVSGVAYSGVYEVASKNGASAAACCYPAGDVIVRQSGAAGSSVNVEWTFASTANGCPAATGLAGTTIDEDAIPDSDTGALVLNDGTNTFNLDVAPLIAGEKVLDLSGGSNPDDCSVVLKQRTIPTLAYAGVYTVEDTIGTDATCCYPVGDVTVTADGTQYNVAWTFGEEAGCTTVFKGQAISGKNTPDAVTKDVTITQQISSTPYSFTLDHPLTNTGAWNLDLSAVNTGCSVILEKKSGYVLGLGSLVALSLSYLMF